MIPKVSFIIPARNEENNIAKMCLILLALYDRYIQEIIVVDDNSADKTASIISKIKITHPKIKLIKRKPPSGVGLAIRDGLNLVSKKSSHIFTIDADFTQNLIDLEEFFLKIKQYDGLIGSRYLIKNSLVNYPLLKKFCNRSFHLLVRLFLGIKNKDLTNNFKLYNKKLYLSLPLTSNDYSINAETGLYPILMGKKIGEIPVVWFARSRNMGTSKFNLLKVAPGYIKVLINSFNYMHKYNNHA